MLKLPQGSIQEVSHGIVKPRDVTKLVNHETCSSVEFDRKCQDYKDFDHRV